MPPKAKFTKEQIVAAALDIVREQGIDAVTARELGARLGSSARPIFTVFASMEEVMGEVILAAKACYKEYIDEGLAEKVPFKGVGMQYIRFAKEEPELFKLLFMTEKENIPEGFDAMAAVDDNYKRILKSVQEPFHLTEERAKKIYRHLWIYTHGIAVLFAGGICSFSEEEINDLISEIFSGLIKNK